MKLRIQIIRNADDAAVIVALAIIYDGDCDGYHHHRFQYLTHILTIWI